MPPKSTASGSKRKAAGPPDASSKKLKNGSSAYKDSTNEEKYGIVDREFYPPEMTNARCGEYIDEVIPKPAKVLDDAQEETETARNKIQVRDAVVHWFKTDLRTMDNKALDLASKKAKSKSVPLICLHIISPQDYKAHMTSSVRVDFALRTLQVLKNDLAKMDIPLHVETVDKRKAIPGRILELCEKWGASHIYANTEYEVDELRREALMTRSGLDKDISLTVCPDTCVVAPGELQSGSGRQYAVYSPWYRAWMKYIHEHPHQLDSYDLPSKNPSSARTQYKEIFESSIPDAPENRKLSAEEKKRFRSMWPPGEHEAHERLEKFIKQKAGAYKDQRNLPAADGTSMLSVHLSSGTLAARTIVRAARDANSSKKLDAGNLGIVCYISEVAWRDFYKHVLAGWPFVW